MLDTLRKGQRWLVLLVIGTIGIVFVFFMGVGSSFQRATPTGSAVIELGDYRVELSDYERARAMQESRMQESFGDQFDARKLRSFIDAQTLQAMVSSAILANSAENMGISVSDEEIQRFVAGNPMFRKADGSFDKDEFRAFTAYEFGSQRNFIEAVRQDMLRQKMVRLLYSQARVSETEARSAALHKLEEVRIAFVALDTENPPEDLKVSPDEAQEYLDENTEDLQVTYEERIDDYRNDDQVRVAHILVEVELNADEATATAAEARAKAALERVLGGEPFEEVAGGVSDDAGTRARGGDLGQVARGDLAPELEAAAFSAEVGVVPRLIRTTAGYHVLDVREHVEGSVIPFEQVSLDLAGEELRATKARESATRQANALADAIRDGKTLEAAATELGIPLERSVSMRRRADGFIPGLGGSQEALATAFSLSLDDPSSPEIFEVGSKLVLIQLVERPELSADALANATAAEKERLLTGKRNRIIDDWVNNLRDELAASGELLVNADLVLGDS